MSIVYVIACFACGVVATTIGACGGFVMAGLTGIAGMGIAAAMNAAALASPAAAELLFGVTAEADILTAMYGNIGPMIGTVSFDVMWAPAISFVAPLWAGAYARKRHYISGADLSNAMCWVPLLDLKRTDVLLAGGVGGVIGGFINWFLTGYLGIGIDGHATAIVISCLICKLIIDGRLVNPRTEEGKKLGTRWGPNQQPGWLPWIRKTSLRYTMAIFCGACFAYCERVFMLNPITFSFAHTIGFLIGATGLMFLMMGFNSQPLMPMVVPGCFIVKGMIIALGNTPEAAASVSELEFMIWGAGGACIGITCTDVLVQLFSIYSDVYIDPPGCAIMCGSFIGFTVIAGSVTLASSIVFPVCCIALALLYAVLEYIKCKDTPMYAKPYVE